MTGPSTASIDAFAGLQATAEALSERSISSEEAVGASLERIASTQDTLNAFKCVRAEAALDEARRPTAG